MRAKTIFLRLVVFCALLGKKGNIDLTSLETPGGFQKENKKWAKYDRKECFDCSGLDHSGTLFLPSQAQSRIVADS